MSVEEYIWEFEQLQIQSRLEEGLEHTMAMFLKGLNSSIAKRLNYTALLDIYGYVLIGHQVGETLQEQETFLWFLLVAKHSNKVLCSS